MNQTITKASAVISPLGDSALVITFGDSIQYDIHKQIKTCKDSIELNPFPGFIECVPAFTNLTIFYNPLEVVAAVKKKEKKNLCLLLK